MIIKKDINGEIRIDYVKRNVIETCLFYENTEFFQKKMQ
jgi:hypothetical protein